jgi:hypothetical protein
MQNSCYVVGSETPWRGRLIQQCLFVDSSRAAALKDDILHLSDTFAQRLQRGYADSRILISCPTVIQTSI